VITFSPILQYCYNVVRAVGCAYRARLTIRCWALGTFPLCFLGEKHAVYKEGLLQGGGPWGFPKSAIQ